MRTWSQIRWLARRRTMRRRERKRKRRQDMRNPAGYTPQGTVDISRLPRGPAAGGEPIEQDGDIQPSATS